MPPPTDAMPPGPDAPAHGGPPDPGEPSSDDRTLAMLSHLLVIFTGFLGPLIIWLVRREQSPFVDDQGKEALNWAITMALAALAASVIAAVPIAGWIVACLAMPAYLALVIVFGILASTAAQRGERYRYPFTLRLIS